VEKVENAELFDGDRSKPYVIVNTEWGAFGDDGKLDAIRTKYDREIDEDSLNPGQQRYVIVHLVVLVQCVVFFTWLVSKSIKTCASE